MVAKLTHYVYGDVMFKKKILVIDKDFDICKGIREFLTDDYEIYLECGKGDVMEKVIGHKIDLIITDIELPNGDIYKFMSRVKSMSTKIPIVLMYVCFDYSGGMEDYVRTLADAIFFKPFDLQKLKKKIDELLNH